MRMFRVIIAALLLTSLAAAQTGGSKQGQAQNATSSSLDRNADPCVDFYQFACGGWVKNNPIPADQSIWSRFGELAERNLNVLHGILEDAAKAEKRTANEQKIGDYYASCMDEDAINKKGAAALKPEFDRINSLKDKTGLPTLLAHLHGEGIGGLFRFGSGSDFKNAKEVIGQADQGGLSLPDRDYYLKDDPKAVQTRKDYVNHVTKMFQLLGDAPDKAAAEAKAVMEIETALAKGAMDRIE